MPTHSEPDVKTAAEEMSCGDLVARMFDSLRKGKRQAACDLAVEISTTELADLRSLALAGRILEIMGGGSGDAERLYRRMAKAAPELLYPRYQLCEVLLQGGQMTEAMGLAAGLVAQAPHNVRVRDLDERARAHATATGFGRWRRWFDGEAALHEGECVANSAIAVVVIGFRAQPSLVHAVASLLGQDEPAEIVVVNSGGGDAAALLAPLATRIRLIHIEGPLYAGAARNIGVDASRAPYVAFLEGDCVAKPGWVRVRLAAHKRGARAVASAIVPSAPDDDLALAAHLCIFGARSPETPPTQALRYGVSYDRQIFAEFGYFNPSLRISEDTNFSRRLGRQVHPTWDPRVQTEHGSPRGRWRFWVEMIGRGRRAARYQPNLEQSPWRPPIFTQLFAAARQRTATALHIADVFLKLEPARQISIRRLIGPASLAYGVGTYLGFLAIHRARRCHQKSQRHHALGAIQPAFRHAEKALQADPANLAVRLELVDLLCARGKSGDSAKADVHLNVATWQSGFHDERLAGLADWMIERKLFEQAWRLGEIAGFSLPSAIRIHERLASAAEAIGDPAAFELAAFDAMARDPSAPPNLVRLYALYEARPRATD